MTTQTFKYFIDFLNKASENIFVNLLYKVKHRVGWCNTNLALFVPAAKQTQRTEKARKEKSIKPFITNIEQIYVTKIFSSWLL